MANWTIEKRWGVYHVYKPDGQLSLRLLTLDALGVHLSMCMEEIERLRAENARLTRERDEARRAENTQCDLRYMETEHRERLEQFVRSLLNPEDRGYAVPAHVRDAARVALGMQAVESATIESCDGSCVTVNAYCPECDRHTKHVMVSDTVRECLTCGALSADLTL